MQEWYPIPGFGGKYEITKNGKVRSLNYRGKIGIIKELKITDTGRYLSVMRNCIADVTRELGYLASNICRACQKSGYAYGFNWKYKEK